MDLHGDTLGDCLPSGDLGSFSCHHPHFLDVNYQTVNNKADREQTVLVCIIDTEKRSKPAWVKEDKGCCPTTLVSRRTITSIPFGH